MREISSKYITSGPIVNRLKNEPIPDDEPLLLLRGRDLLAPEAMDYYLKLREDRGADPIAQSRLREDIEQMRLWQSQHSDRTRMPDQPGHTA